MFAKLNFSDPRYRPVAGIWFFSSFFLAALTCIYCLGATVQEPDEKIGQPKILARINEYEITEQTVFRFLSETFPNLGLDSRQDLQPQLSKLDSSLIRTSVEQLINRRVAFEYLRKSGFEIKPDELRLEQASLEKRLREIGRSLDDFLKEKRLSSAELEYEIAWGRTWQNYLNRVLTDEYLEQHFNRFRRQFDDSEMRVAHLLIKTEHPNSVQTAVESAGKIRKEILSATRYASDSADATLPGKSLSNPVDQAWNAAVKKHSAAPTADEGGEIGWIRFHEPMSKAFSVAAFSLEPGQISSPVVTAHGVHLIRCLELREGKTGWRDSLDAVKAHAAKTLLDQIAKQYRSQVAIEMK